MKNRFFFVIVVFILLVVTATGLYLSHLLRQHLEEEVKTRLQGLSVLAKETIITTSSLASNRDIDALSDRLGKVSEARITIIDEKGILRGDSQLNLDQLKGIENHGQRPEVIEAKSRGFGFSKRYSHTLHTNMLYMATSFTRSDLKGTIRVSIPLNNLEKASRRLYLLLSIAALLAFLLALFTSHLIARTISSRFRSLVVRINNLSQSDNHNKQLPKQGIGLIRSLNCISNEIEDLFKALSQERDRFASLLEGIGEGVLAFDANQRLTHFNNSAVHLLAPLELKLGISFEEITKLRSLHTQFKHALQGESTSLECEIEGFSKTRVIAVRLIAQQVTGGGVVIAMSNLSKIRRLEAMRQDFVANVSHELRTPVSIILANAETLLSGALDDKKHATKFVEALERQAQRLKRLITDLLEISKIDANKIELDYQEIEIKQILGQIVSLFSEKASEKKLELNLEQEKALNIFADPKAFEHIVENLVDNATKYTPEEGKIVVRAYVTPTSTIIEVADSGPGIPQKHRNRIFERFYRVDRGRSREIGGTGLGLSIARNLVLSMGGKIGFKPAEPSGSIFWFSLPHRK